MSTRLVRIGSLAGVLCLAAACGGVGGSGTSGGGSGGGGKVTLTSMGFGTGDEIATVRADAAKKAIAPATVKFSQSSFNPQQFLSAVASGSPPDLVYMDRQLVGTYATKGTLLPLTDCVRDQHIDMNQYRPAAVSEVTLNGTLYGLPEFYDNRVLYVNDAVVRQAGMQPSDIDTSDWQALQQAAVKMAKRSGKNVTRIGFDPKLPEFLPLWAKANGVSLISVDGKTANLDDPEVVQALEYTVGLIQKQGGWASFKSFRDSWDFFGAKNELAENQLGAFPMEDWYITQLAEVSPKLRITVKPFEDRQGRPIDWATGAAWAITKDSKHQAQACKFIKTMTDAATWVKAATVKMKAAQKKGEPYVGTYTGNQVADQKIFNMISSSNPSYKKAVQEILAVQQHAFSLPSSPAGAEFQSAWQSAVNRVLSGQQTPKAALAQAQQEAQTALDKATHGN